ncbi:MAG: DUF4258 domain-containing protein [Deltaproteobacteria bacterium]|nr:DUF4258 domain-containing protein [Deltaproteobacteria bacterium]
MANKLIFRIHAIQRMFQRAISEEDVRHILKSGKVIEDYPGDTPYPSRLVFGWCGERPLHVVAADNRPDRETIVVTAYEPDLSEWENGFSRRKKR